MSSLLMPSFLFDSTAANFLLLTAWIRHPTRPLWNFHRASLACPQMGQLHTDALIFVMHEHLHCRINLLEPLMPSGRLCDLADSMIEAHVGCGGRNLICQVNYASLAHIISRRHCTVTRNAHEDHISGRQSQDMFPNQQ